ncbi:N-acetylmuramic acid 6-phosphate etherase [Nonomuraea gerenzanensis]|uniref:N-acetylmuramic acid 6-phosphate etherase n=1 Tax=Nonomuraea gerenzanensis TaxID=93944 RepID=A0A1M4EHK8_9ACTN|nr:N-acetylmuramic acid 6-phosphate etherase [Nonomuraea gerenzanensis]UBU09849.1 N-acetylmuramic acid 6-phosphate etherase [Nonomuraea gerenzanensis]SBO98300.1 N-acetylmuramic acid 6-phosphate etherase [Nonomuraea gerenzanensis]
MNLSELTTESADPRFAGIDTMSVGELAAAMNAADTTVPAAVAAALPDITAAIEATAARMEAGGRLVYVGAGTPGRLGVLDASECPPTFSTPPEQVFAIIAGGESAIVSPCEGAEDDELAGAAAVDAALIGPLDTVVGVASSGRTPYVLAAVRRAREHGALTVGLSCNAGTPLSAAAEHAIEVLVGPEVISGSTRLKAGTAQKLVLNMFSTIVMVRLGKTYGNLMVDVKASNGKLRERAVRMVRTITGSGREEALAALDANGFNVKQAVVATRFDLSPQDAAARLAAAGGRLRAALGELS